MFQTHVLTESLSPVTVIPSTRQPCDDQMALSPAMDQVGSASPSDGDILSSATAVSAKAPIDDSAVDDGKVGSETTATRRSSQGSNHTASSGGSGGGGARGVSTHLELRNILIGPLCVAVTSPEAKRQIIGDTFIRVAEEFWSNLNLDNNHLLLCQGKQPPPSLLLLIPMLLLV